MPAKFSNSFDFERALWRQNVLRVAGVDEAGRGPLAGPVVAAAAILPPRWAEAGLPAELAGLNDSKQLTEAQREKFSPSSWPAAKSNSASPKSARR